MLSCGSGGSTGQQIVNAINMNTYSRGFVFDFSQDDLGIEDTYVPLCNIDYPDLPIGIYVITFSATFSHASVTNSTLLKFIFDGVEEVFQYEASDINDRIPVSYSFPIEFTSPHDLSLALEMAREGGTAELNCYFSNLMIQKVAETQGFPVA